MKFWEDYITEEGCASHHLSRFKVDEKSYLRNKFTKFFETKERFKNKYLQKESILYFFNFYFDSSFPLESFLPWLNPISVIKNRDYILNYTFIAFQSWEIVFIREINKFTKFFEIIFQKKYP